MEENKTQTLITFSMIIVLSILASTFAIFLGSGKGGFNITNILTQFGFYGWPFVIGVFVIFIIYVLETIYLKDGDKEYGNYIFFNSPGEGPSLLTSRFKNPIKLFLFCLIVFSLLGLVATFYKQTYFGVGTLEQQFTQVDGILYNWFLVVTSENVQAFMFGIAGIFFLRMLARKYDWGKINFLVLSAIIFILLFTIFGVVNHQLRYSGQEQNILKVAAFWSFGGLISVISGSFIPFYVMHGINNTYVDINTLFTNEILAVYVVGICIFLSIIYYLLFIRRRIK